ncbi:hypothetical protein BDV19DRAFT_353564 [Aspergillus venezuelensis]
MRAHRAIYFIGIVHSFLIGYADGDRIKSNGPDNPAIAGLALTLADASGASLVGLGLNPILWRLARMARIGSSVHRMLAARKFN